MVYANNLCCDGLARTENEWGIVEADIKLDLIHLRSLSDVLPVKSITKITTEHVWLELVKELFEPPQQFFFILDNLNIWMRCLDMLANDHLMEMFAVEGDHEDGESLSNHVFADRVVCFNVKSNNIR